ncbi:MAG: imelysin family protein [Pseudomonadota bacterium]
MARRVDPWNADGAARAAATTDPAAGVVARLAGMGNLSHGEQAGERMRLGLMLNDPQEEHDRFADDTPTALAMTVWASGTSAWARMRASTGASSPAPRRRA